MIKLLPVITENRQPLNVPVGVDPCRWLSIDWTLADPRWNAEHLGVEDIIELRKAIGVSQGEFTDNLCGGVFARETLTRFENGTNEISLDSKFTILLSMQYRYHLINLKKSRFEKYSLEEVTFLKDTHLRPSEAIELLNAWRKEKGLIPRSKVSAYQQLLRIRKAVRKKMNQEAAA